MAEECCLQRQGMKAKVAYLRNRMRGSRLWLEWRMETF